MLVCLIHKYLKLQ
uniref:Uncharacterized protein n=1 Tax=Rhizophora mucronata TaxID=61149 RepID=A0A2P2QDC1_RHIMU